MKQRAYRFYSIILFALTAIPLLSAAPVITSVQNAASNIGFNSPVAQGAIFVLKGSGLGPANITIAPAAFQSTTLSGTSVSVTVGTTTVNALMYYTSAGQVAALLPSNTPTGAGSFTVTYNGQVGNSVGHAIVASNLGIFTIDSTGQGPGIVTFADYSLVSAVKAANCGGPSTSCGAANPGDTLILWATGLGPVSGGDASGAGLGVAMPDVPLTLWLGGIQAPVVYQGRTGCCIGEDQIVFTVPNNVPTGCGVPLVVQIGTASNTISNSTVMPIAKGSRNCTSNNVAIASVNAAQAVLAGPVNFGDIDLEKGFNDNGGGFVDQAHFQFGRLTFKPGTEPFDLSYGDPLPLGTCYVYATLNPNDNGPIVGFDNLDGGSSFIIQGPNGSVTLTGSSGDFQTINAAGTFLGPGAYTVKGTGGKDVGPFSATITIPTLPTLVSPLTAANLSVTRSSGMPITWKGGDGNVELAVMSATDSTRTLGSLARCKVPASAGTFTIPPYVMLALPAGNFATFTFNSAESDVAFTATGITVGTLHTQSNGTSVGFFMLK
jgi:uncharacterized protein (TIGR03437 family)